MAAVFIHGNTETAAIWGPPVWLLSRDDVVLLSPPSFGAPIPVGRTEQMVSLGFPDRDIAVAIAEHQDAKKSSGTDQTGAALQCDG